MAENIEIPDEMLDKHFFQSPSDTIPDEDTSPEPVAEGEEPASPPEETLAEVDEDPEWEEEAETEDLEAGDVEPVEEVELEEDELLEDEFDEDLEDLEDDELDLDEDVEDEPEDTLESDSEEEDDFLPDFDRKKIEEDPDLHAAYKHMRAKWTQAQQELRSAQKEFQARATEFDEFATQLQSDEGAQEFLVAVALNRPEVFEQAYQRSVELTSDDSERRSWEREQEVKQRERELNRRERREKQAALESRVREIRNRTVEVAENAGLTSPAEIAQAEEAVAGVIRTKRASDPEADISDSDIENAVHRVADTVKAIKARTRKELEREYLKKRKKAAKKKAKSSKRPSPPKSSSAPGSIKSNKPSEPPKGVDPLDHWVDETLGVG